MSEQNAEIISRLERLEAKLDSLIGRKPAKEWYNVAEFAQEVGKKPFTVREWCRNRRINGGKSNSGRGRTKNWKISHEELVRYLNDGLLPPPPGDTTWGK